jgi:Putative DNA-binding domain
MTVNPLFARLGIPADADTLAGIRRLVGERAIESRHLDFKRQFNNVDDLADDLASLANIGGGVLIIGIGTDNVDRAASFHEHPLMVIEQQAVQAARDGIDEPLRIEPVTVPGDTDPARGFLVVTIPPSDRTPHITVKRGRVLHRVGTHNKPMTRRELGAAFAGGGDMFAAEFGLSRGYGTTAVKCELVPPFGSPEWGVAVMNVGLLPARDVMVASAKYQIRWAEDGGIRPGLIPQGCVREPSYLPIRSLAPGSDVVLMCLRDEHTDPIQDVLLVTWKTPDGRVHRNEQSWSWTLRWAPPARAV